MSVAATCRPPTTPFTELHIRDVGVHELLYGLYSRNDWSHPGPVYFYLLAPLYRLTGNASIAMNIGALLINGARSSGWGSSPDAEAAPP